MSRLVSWHIGLTAIYCIPIYRGHLPNVKLAFFSCAVCGCPNYLVPVCGKDVTEPGKIRIRRMWISYAESIRCGCGFVAQPKL